MTEVPVHKSPTAKNIAWAPNRRRATRATPSMASPKGNSGASAMANFSAAKAPIKGDSTAIIPAIGKSGRRDQ